MVRVAVDFINGKVKTTAEVLPIHTDEDDRKECDLKKLARNVCWAECVRRWAVAITIFISAILNTQFGDLNC